MYSKSDLMAALAKEMNIIKHLGTKVSAGQENFRPTPAQRSTLELMQYLTYAGVSMAKFISLEGNGDTSKIWEERSEAAKGVTIENFGAAIDKASAELVALIGQFTDEELAKEVNIYGMGLKTKGAYLVEGVLTMAVAYKMQLFLYAKQSGASDIGTMNLWAGMDAPAKE